MRALVSSAAFAATLAFGGLALAADPRSYTTALEQLPTDYGIIATVDAKALRAAPSYTQTVAQLLAMEKGATAAVADVKALCKIDVTTALDDVTLGFDGADVEKPAVFVHASGIDEKKVTACIQALGKKSNKTITMKSSTFGSAKVAEYATAGDAKKRYIGFVNDVVVLVQGSEKAALEKALSGKGALGKSRALQTWQGKISTSSLAYVLVVKEVVEPKFTLKGMAASADLSGGDIKIKSTSELKDAVAAKVVSGELTRVLGSAPRELARSAKSFKVTTQAATVSVEGTIYESEYKQLKKP